MELTTDQEIAIFEIKKNWIFGNSKFYSLKGPAGSGKTFILNLLKNEINYECYFVATTGKASLRLKELIGESDGTLHSILYFPPKINNSGKLEFNILKSPEKKFLIIDESSMITPKLYDDLIRWTYFGVKILFVGDQYQLPPVLNKDEEEIYGENFSIFDIINGSELKEIVRNQGGIINQSEKLRSNFNFRKLESEDNFYIKYDKYPGRLAINNYLENEKNSSLITWTNSLRMKANKIIRYKKGYFEKEILNNEPILIFRNGINYLNGEITYNDNLYLYKKIEEFNINVHRLNNIENICLQGKNEYADGGFPYISNFKLFKKISEDEGLVNIIPVSYGYVLTAHKAQGSEFDETNIFLSNYDLNNKNMFKETQVKGCEDKIPFINRWLYTAITRAKNKTNLFFGK